MDKCIDIFFIPNGDMVTIYPAKLIVEYIDNLNISPTNIVIHGESFEEPKKIINKINENEHDATIARLYQKEREEKERNEKEGERNEKKDLRKKIEKIILLLSAYLMIIIIKLNFIENMIMFIINCTSGELMDIETKNGFL